MNSIGSSRYGRLTIVVLAALTAISVLFYTFSNDSKASLASFWPVPHSDAAGQSQSSVKNPDLRPPQSAEQPSKTETMPARPVHALPTVSSIEFEELGDKGDYPVSTDTYLQALGDPLPIIDFTDYKDLPHAHGQASERFTFATYLCNHDPNIRHPYFAAVQSLVWRILWSPWSTKKYPMTVLVCPITPHIVRDILRGQGAIVEELPFLDGPEVRLNVGRWQDMYSKLSIWNLTSWDKIAFMDVDALPIKNIDDIFDVPTQVCNKTRMNSDDYQLYQNHPSEAEEFCNYLFAGVEWPDYFLGRHELNAGFLLLKPNRLMYERLLIARYQTDKYAVAHLEQGLLASDEVGFGQKSPFPMHRLSRAYNVGLGVYYDKELVSRAKVLHEKIWNRAMMRYNELYHDRWDVDWMAMCRFYDSPAFDTSRKLGFLRLNMLDQNTQFGGVVYPEFLDDRERAEHLEKTERDRQEAQEKASADEARDRLALSKATQPATSTQSSSNEPVTDAAIEIANESQSDHSE